MHTSWCGKSIMLVTKICEYVKHIRQRQIEEFSKPKNFCQELEFASVWLKANPFWGNAPSNISTEMYVYALRGCKSFMREMEAIILTFMPLRSLSKDGWRKLKQSCGCVFKTAMMNRGKSSKTLLEGKLFF